MKLRVLELYSGIGGMHFALKESQAEFEIVLAVDINTTANKVYKHNFADANLQSFGIEKLSLNQLEDLHINTILMSPPCQPFTRVGKKRDCHDVRTKSFIHVLDLIRNVKVKPVYILVENVKGFETSETRSQLVECLRECSYTYQEFLLTPLQFGIPNSRLRYYLTARWDATSAAVENYKILTDLQTNPSLPNDIDSFHQSAVSMIDLQSNSKVTHCTKDTAETLHNSNSSTTEPGGMSSLTYTEPQTQTSSHLLQQSCLESLGSPDAACGSSHVIPAAKPSLKDVGRNMRYCEEDDKYINNESHALSDYMEHTVDIDLQDYWLTDKELRMFVIMDIVYPDLKKSICFTKRYGHYVEGAGSVVQMSSNIEHVRAASDLKHKAVNSLNRHEWGEQEMDILRNLRLRYFIPREVANLLCFPKDFSFPEGLSKVQKYRVLGNSLNVKVVAILIKYLTQSL